MKKFSLEISLSVTLDASQLWPDGDGPDNPTEDDVMELIEKCGGAESIIDDWSLGDNLDYHVIELKPLKKEDPVK